MYYSNQSISLDTVHINQTRKYLVQQVQHYGEEFMHHIKNNQVLVYAVQDYKTGSKKIEPHIYALIDVNGEKRYNIYVDQLESRKQFQKSLSFFQNHYSYVTDYCYDSNKTGHLHVIVFKLPFPEKLKYFLEGQYSKMYSEEELKKWFPKTIRKNKTEQWMVLTKDKEHIPIFIKKLENEFGKLKITNDDLIDAELDFPPNLKNEILRYDI